MVGKNKKSEEMAMMKKFMKKLWEKKDSKKGFTLVELIVVLVILAILAAIMVPSLLGWINKAKEKELILSARNAELAAQTVLYEKYVANKYADITAVDSLATITGDDLKEVEKIAGSLAGVIIKWSYGTDGLIKGFEYIADGKSVSYDGNAWTVDDVPTTS